MNAPTPEYASTTGRGWRRVGTMIAVISAVVICGPMTVDAYQSPTAPRILLTTLGCACVSIVLLRIWRGIGKFEVHMDEYPAPDLEPRDGSQPAPRSPPEKAEDQQKLGQGKQ